MNETRDKQTWRCLECGYLYDPAEGDQESCVSPGTPYSELPEAWCCPVCYQPKNTFLLHP
jgi:rubredoxin